MVKIYTDGAFSSSRNCGGWAFIVLENGIKIHSAFGSAKNTTNNRMEIMASLKAIEWAEGKEITIFTDSMYVIGCASKGWKRNKNGDLWVQMDDVMEGVNITWEHVKGHNGDKYNSQCDMLAVHASQIIINE